MSRGQLFLLRHGETEWARAGRHTGRTDLPLTPDGEAAARARRADLQSTSFGLVLTSPLQRARTTAALALEGADVAAEVVDDLAEWNYGQFEGLTTAEIRAKLNKPDWLIWDTAIPDGEQLSDVAARAQRVIARVLPTLLAGRNCLCVAHGHFLRILTAAWLDLEPRAARLWLLKAAGLCVLGHEREQRVIVEWNK